MVATSVQDFQSVLDDLIAEAADTLASEWVSAPSLAPDYLAVAESALFSQPVIGDGDAFDEYRDVGGLDWIEDEDLAAIEADASLPTEPTAIAAELALDGASAGDLQRIRRRFAFSNHPDRVAPHLRERALVRMQVANSLIDESMRHAAH